MHMLNRYATPLAAPLVVKYGGNAMAGDAAEDPVLEELAELWNRGDAVVVVHGGGPEIDRWLELRGVVTERIDGLRVTDAVTLEVTEAVLCGSLNKRLVRALRALGLPAVGISGEDGDLLIATRASSPSGRDLGFVGEVTQCKPELLHALLDAGYLPVIAPLATASDSSTCYNVNADLAAAAIAGSLHARAFFAITNVPRALRDPDDLSSGIDHLTLEEARDFAQSDGCRSSMKPKLQATIAAVEAGAHASYICAAGPASIRRALAGDATVISR